MPDHSLPAQLATERDLIAARFLEATGGDAGPLAGQLLDELARLQAAALDDPFASPVQRLALLLSQQLADGRLTVAALRRLTQYLATDAFVARAERLGRYLGETDPAANDQRLAALFEGLARSDGGEPVAFASFKARVERELFGIVFTAHPTFNLSGELMAALARLATGRGEDGAPLGDEERRRLIELAAKAEHRPDRELTLAREHALSLQAIANFQAAMRRAIGVLLGVARRLYPEEWTVLTPRLVTVATWVGYDLDGRSDIRWSDSLQYRLRTRHQQLGHYLDEVRAIRAIAPADRALRDALDVMESRLALAHAQLGDEVEAFATPDIAAEPGARKLQQIARRMYAVREARLVDAAGLIALVDRAADSTGDAALLTRLSVLRAELTNLGLGMAHVHVRINSTQVHNAIRKAVGLVAHPNDPRYRQSYLDRITALLDGVRPSAINFGSMLAERTSVKQLFMVVAQMVKYGDRGQPIRFLIAECESAFTVLTALYFARLFGVEDRVDLSPLFETEKALEGGSRVIEQLLDNPHYRAYVVARGRLAVQTGYSDAGRFIGQMPAAASIERLKLRLLRVLAKHGLGQVQLVIFDTHGESIGRGGHPGGMAERLAYPDTAAVRALAASHGISLKPEVSFQGGDGYLPFFDPAAAYATVTRVLEHALVAPEAAGADSFYEEGAYIREFFTTIKAFQVGLMEDANYGALLSAFGANLLYPSGSRASKRQYDEPGEMDRVMAAELRAIPHNAILQQLGLMANSVGGLGAAIGNDPERFAQLLARSARFRQLLAIGIQGARFSDPQVMQAYVDTLDPRFWIARAAATADAARAQELLKVADALGDGTLHERQNRVLRRLARDFALLRHALEAAPQAEPGPFSPDRATRDRMALLQAIRLAAILEIFALATRIPHFVPRSQSVTLRSLVTRLLHLDVPAVVTLLQEIFPIRTETAEPMDFGEPSDYVTDESQNYQYENEQIFQPLAACHELVRQVSAALVHRIGAFG